MRLEEQREYEFILRNRGNDIGRRRLMEWMLKVGFTLPAASFLSASALSACGGSSGQLGGGGGGGQGFSESSDTMKIACLGPFSGIGSFIGAIIERSLDAATQQVNSTGGIGGRKIQLEKKDISAADVQQIINAYQDIASQGDFTGIVWGMPGGLIQLKDKIATDQILIAGCFVDLFSSNELFPQQQATKPVFQFLIPNNWAMNTLADYIKSDRGFTKVGYIYDTTLGESSKGQFQETMSKYGMQVTGIAQYTLNNSNFAPQVSQVGNPQTIWMWGIATDTANCVKELAKQGKAYQTIDAAKAGTNPQLMGSPAALGERKWAELAGEAAKAGTLTAWHIGGLIYLPGFQIREWMKKYTGADPTGGEESPADAMYMIANAVKNAQTTTDRAKLISAVETAGKQQFASLPFEFTADNHLSKHPDDMIIATLERGKPATPDYELGREFKEVFPPGYVGPTHLVRPTVEQNKRRHPETMQVILNEKWGSQCPAGHPLH